MNRSKADVLRQIVLALGASGFTAGMLMIISIIITRVLDVSGRGEVAATVLLPTILMYLGQLGLPSATGYWISVSPEDRDDLVGTARSLAMILSIVLLVVCWYAVSVLPLDISAKTPAFVFSLVIPFRLLSGVDRAILQTDMRANALNFSRVSASLFSLVGVALVVLLGMASVSTMVFAQLGGIVCQALITVGLLGAGARFSFNMGSARKLLSYGIRAHLGTIQPVDTLRIDQLILGLFLSAHALGVYVVAMTFVTVNRLIGTSFGLVAFPVAAKEGQPGKHRMLLSHLVSSALVLTIFTFALEVFFGRNLLHILFDIDDQETYQVMVILVGGSIFMVVRQVVSDIVRGKGAPWLPTVAELVSFGALLLLLVPLWRFGLLGVAWAVTLSAAISLSVLLGCWKYVASSDESENHRRAGSLMERSVS